MRFHFAISFAGAQRSLARSLAGSLRAQGFEVFFDEDYEHEMLGGDGVEYLNNVFFRDSQLCIVLLSREYDQSAWTRLERRAFHARELTQEVDCIVPVLVDGYRPSWLLPNRIYFDLQTRGMPLLFRHLKAKIAPQIGIVEGMGGAATFGGEWQRSELNQTQLSMEHSVIHFGDPDWSDYDFRFRAVSDSGSHGFKALFHCLDAQTYCEFALGNYYNKAHDLCYWFDGNWDRPRDTWMPGSIDLGRWYDVFIRVRRSEFWCFLDGQELFHDVDARFCKGKIGLATWHATARFSRILITSPSGMTLWSGTPEPPQ